MCPLKIGSSCLWGYSLHSYGLFLWALELASSTGIFLLGPKSLYPQQESYSRKPRGTQSYAKYLPGYTPGGTQTGDLWTPGLQHLREKPEAPKGGNTGHALFCEGSSPPHPRRRYPGIAAGTRGRSQPGAAGHRAARAKAGVGRQKGSWSHSGGRFLMLLSEVSKAGRSDCFREVGRIQPSAAKSQALLFLGTIAPGAPDMGLQVPQSHPRSGPLIVIFPLTRGAPPNPNLAASSYRHCEDVPRLTCPALAPRAEPAAGSHCACAESRRRLPQDPAARGLRRPRRCSSALNRRWALAHPSRCSVWTFLFQAHQGLEKSFSKF